MNLLNLYDFWFNSKKNNFWFNSTKQDDLLIYNNFHQLFSIDYNIHNLTLKELVALVILHDQVIRHSNRVLNIKEQINQSISINICNLILSKFENNLNDNEFVFVMLPFRHTNEFTNIKFVLDKTWKRLEQNKTETLTKFIKATYERYVLNNKNNNKLFDTENIIIRDTNNIDSIFINSYNNEIIDIVKDNLKSSNKKLILSLSGGVDSMVLSYILKILKIPYIAIFINYCNRECYLDEENFIVDWCNKNNIKLYIRRITEINREKCMNFDLRDLYESYTKDIRFNSYKNVSIMENINLNVLMGHNRDDCFENILTNITNKSKYENLLGMEINSIIDNITFIRPMLNVDKKDIYKFAETFNIPHLPNSTPEWSQRGKIRDIVRPTLELWNEKSIEGFFNLSNILTEQQEIIDSVIDNIISNIRNKSILLKSKDKLLLKNVFWKNLFMKMNIKFSQKGLNNFIIRLDKFIKNIDKQFINAISQFELGFNSSIKWCKIKNNDLIFYF